MCVRYRPLNSSILGYHPWYIFTLIQRKSSVCTCNLFHLSDFISFCVLRLTLKIVTQTYIFVFCNVYTILKYENAFFPRLQHGNRLFILINDILQYSTVKHHKISTVMDTTRQKERWPKNIWRWESDADTRWITEKNWIGKLRREIVKS